MRPDRDLASVRHLCSLGLPAEQAVPALLRTAAAMLGADTAQFLWVTPRLEPCRFYLDTGDEALAGSYLERWRSIDLPEAINIADRLARFSFCNHGGKGDDAYYGTSIYREFMSPIGGECVLSAAVRDPAGALRGAFSLCRDRRAKPYSEADQRRILAIASQIAVLFEPGDIPVRQAEHRVARGTAFFDPAGKLAYSDDTAYQLLFLAGQRYIEKGAANGYSDGGVMSRIARLGESLLRLQQGLAAPAPYFEHRGPWGRFCFSGRIMGSTASTQPPLLAIDISHYLPLRLALWKRLQGLGLPPRLEQVCIEFGAGASLTEVAARLGLSRHTVIDYVDSLYARFGLEPGREALVRHLMGDDRTA